MPPPAERKCPDCQVEMGAIILIDKTHPGGMHQQLEYATGDAQLGGLWRGTRFPVAGNVGACMCGQCGRILLYGFPREPV